MKSVSTELAAALTAPERVLTPRVTCDWDGDGFNGRGTVDDLSRGISSLQIDQTLTSNVPSIAQPVAGAAVGQLVVDVEQGHLFGVPMTPVVRNLTSSTAATGTGTISVTRGPVKPGDTILTWIAYSGQACFINTNDMSVVWKQLASRGDFTSTSSRQTTGFLLVRRVGVTQADADAEPNTYTFKQCNSTPWVAHCVVIASDYAPGIHALTSKGADPDSRLNTTYTLLQGRRITTTLDNCLLLGFFAGYAVGTGVTWTPDAPATELADVCSASAASNNVATCVTQVSNATAGSYTLGATISVATEPGVVAVVALSPMIAGDDTQNAAWTYSELNPSSLLAGKSRLARPVTVSLEVATTAGAQSVPLFTGQSLGVDVSSRSRKATLTALDNRELMRGDTQLLGLTDAVIAENPLMSAGETLPTFPGLEATWLVSYVFSYCRAGQNNSLGAPSGDGFFASPNVRPATMLHVPCHGSLEPFLGFTLYAYAQSSLNSRTRVTFGSGPWVAATSAAPVGGKIDAKWSTSGTLSTWRQDFTGNSSTVGRVEIYLQRSLPVSGTATIGGIDPVNVSNFFFLDLLATGVLQLRLGMNSGITRTVTGPSFPADGAWHAVGVHWDSTTGIATFKVDTTTTNVGFAAFTNGSLATFAFPNCYATLTAGVRMAELQISGGYPITGTDEARVIRASDPFAWDNFTPTAFIDQSENVLDSTVPIDAGTDSYGLLSDLADAEFAAVYFDANGYPHYRTRASDVSTTGQTVQRTLTTLSALKDIDYQSGVDQLANSIQAPFTPIVIEQNVQVWEPSSPLRIPANSTFFSIDVTLPGIRVDQSSDVFTIGNGNTLPDGSGVVVTGNFSMSATSNGTQGTVILSNNNPFDVWMVDVSGNPTVSWTSAIVKSGTATLTTAVTDDDSIRAYGVQTPVNGIAENRWRQRQDTASVLARLLITDLANPGPVLTNVKVVGDPRLELGDLVRLVDQDGLGLVGNYRLVGVSPSYAPDEGFTQTLVARRTGLGPGGLAGGGCGVAIWDTSFWDDCTVWGV